MRVLSNQEQAIVSGADGISLMVPIDPNTPINFSTGFQSGVDFVGGMAGFLIGIPCAFVILPVKGLYYFASSVYEAVHL